VEKRAEDTVYEPSDARLQSLGRIEVRWHRSMGVVTNELWAGGNAVRSPDAYWLLYVQYFANQPTLGQVTKQLTSVHEKALKGRSDVHSVQ